MRPVFIDFETYWAADHNLSKMSPIDYVLHERTQIISMAIKVGKYPTDVIFGEDKIRHVLSKMDFNDSLLIAHNMSEFDAMILAWRFGVKPKMWGCTMAMARPVHAKTTGLSLKALAQHYSLGVKDNTALVNTKGKRLEDFTPAELAAMEEYNRDDTELCAKLFYKIVPTISADEMFHLDCNIRMLVEPKFVVDRGLLQTALSIERANKYKALLDLAQQLGYSWYDAPDGYVNTADIGADPVRTSNDVYEFVREQLASAPKFSALLESLGVEVPMKPSPTNPEKRVPALAKTDEEFVALQDHPNPIVAAAARARLDVKSTLLETRIGKFVETADKLNGLLPVPLRIYGADTTGRDSGQLYNPQNLPRIGDKPKTSDALRNSLRAPQGYVVGVADQSGIELRVNHFLWKVESSMQLYQASPDKADLYRAFASSLFNVPAEEISKPQRQVGKVAQLGLGFGSGAKTFRRIAKIMGGIDLPEAPPDPDPTWFDDEGYVRPAFAELYREHREHRNMLTCESVVNTWRQTYAPIVDGWKQCGAALTDITQGVERAVDPWGLVTTHKDGLVLPSGRMIRYPGLRLIDDGQTWPDGRSKKSWTYGEGRHKTYLTGPKVCENIVQAVARDSVFEAALRFYKLTRLRPVMRVHDELIYMFPRSEAESLLAELQKILRSPPSWWPQLITWSEGDLAETYGAAK